MYGIRVYSDNSVLATRKHSTALHCINTAVSDAIPCDMMRLMRACRCGSPPSREFVHHPGGPGYRRAVAHRSVRPQRQGLECDDAARGPDTIRVPHGAAWPTLPHERQILCELGCIHSTYCSIIHLFGDAWNDHDDALLLCSLTRLDSTLYWTGQSVRPLPTCRPR